GFAPDGLRHPVSLSLTETPFAFAAPDAMVAAGLLLDSGASIVGDPGASVSLNSRGALIDLRSITAPGGTISLVEHFLDTFLGNGAYGAQLNAAFVNAFPQELWIGSSAVLNVGGVFVPNPRVLSYATGTALDGGTITLAGSGEVVVLPGAY